MIFLLVSVLCAPSTEVQAKIDALYEHDAQEEAVPPFSDGIAAAAEALYKAHPHRATLVAYKDFARAICPRCGSKSCRRPARPPSKTM